MKRHGLPSLLFSGSGKHHDAIGGCAIDSPIMIVAPQPAPLAMPCDMRSAALGCVNYYQFRLASMREFDRNVTGKMFLVGHTHKQLASSSPRSVYQNNFTRNGVPRHTGSQLSSMPCRWRNLYHSEQLAGEWTVQVSLDWCGGWVTEIPSWRQTRSTGVAQRRTTGLPPLGCFLRERANLLKRFD